MQKTATRRAIDPQRYFESAAADNEVPDHEPVCLYLETTNRCNLLCTTCPRTYEELEPPADMSWELFTSIVDQIPQLQRAVLHGVGEPMLVKNLPRMVRYLKDRGTYVLFNTNGTVLNEKNGRALIAAELDELRVSFDAANAKSYLAIRGKNYFNRILKNVRAFRELQEREGHAKPRVSAWLTGLRETIAELPDFVRVAAETGVKEVHLQRMVFFNDNAIGMARPDQALYERLSGEEAVHVDRATELARSLGIEFSASGGASEPGVSLKRRDDGSPWSLCRRPWTVMYFTANGRALPCCIAPFSQRGYENYYAGRRHAAEFARDLDRSGLWRIPQGAEIECAAAGLRQLRLALELVAMDPEAASVAVVIPTFNEAESIAAVVAELPREVVGRVIVADGGSTDGTPEQALKAGAEVVSVGRGYGLACLAGAEAATGTDIIVFMDGDGADDPTAIAALVAPIEAGRFDFVIASRARGDRQPGSMAWHQIAAGLVAGLLTKQLYGVRYTDMCAFRAIRRDTLLALGMREMTYRLESRNADARGACRTSRSRAAGGLPPPPRWSVEGCRFAARLD